MRGVRSGPQPVASPSSSQLGWGLRAAFAGPVEKAVARRQEGKFRGRNRDAGAATGQRLAHGCGWTQAGTRYQFQVQHPQPPTPTPGATRIFPGSGFPGRNGTGSQVSLEWGRNCCLHSQGKNFQQRPLACIQRAAPVAVEVGPWEQGGCFENAVASHGHRGITLCLHQMEIKLLLIDCDP